MFHTEHYNIKMFSMEYDPRVTISVRGKNAHN